MNFNIDFSKVSGKIKAMHAIGQPPLEGVSTEHFVHLKEAGIPYSRLHDVGGWFGGNMWVDIPNIFRDFNADPTNPDNYDFTFTDILIKSLIENGCEPYYRLGVTIENFSEIKSYRIFPPADFKKWAVICEHIIRHYNEGWANGFEYGIQYWEIWNEPDNGPYEKLNHMWRGTPEQFYELYDITAKHLRECFGDSIKIGGYGSSGVGYALNDPEKYGLDVPAFKTDGDAYMMLRGQHMLDFANNFFAYIKEHKSPLDFFSWHAYGSVTEKIAACSKYIDKLLKDNGYENAENHLNEWTVSPMSKARGTAIGAVGGLATMCRMQDMSTNILCMYDGRIGNDVYCGLFNQYPKKLLPLFYAHKAFNELYKLGGHVKPEYEADGVVYAQAATDGDKRAFIITNTAETPTHIETNLDKSMKAYIIDDTHNLEPVEIDPTSFVLGATTILLFMD